MPRKNDTGATRAKKPDKDGLIRQYETSVIRQAMGYTVEIIENQPDGTEKRASIDLIDLGWSQAESLAKAIERNLRNQKIKYDIEEVQSLAFIHKREEVERLAKQLNAARHQLLDMKEKYDIFMTEGDEKDLLDEIIFEESQKTPEFPEMVEKALQKRKKAKAKKS